MASNQLIEGRPEKRRGMSQQELVDHGNAHLASIGRSHEVHWFLHNGRVTIGWR